MFRRVVTINRLLRTTVQKIKAQGPLRLTLMILLPLLVISYVQAMEMTSKTATLRFAIIGDFGVDNSKEAAVALLVKSWNPEFVVTVGDNNYLGAASAIDRAIGKYYRDYIAPYQGTYGSGSSSGNRFYPALGNHDWESLSCSNGVCQGPYFDYFTLPGNERYYDFVQGPVHFFLIDSDAHEPDGISATSAQAAWLRARLAASTAPWKLVILHHPPYSSGPAGSTKAMQWPFKSWGADVVLAGHDHHYERLDVNGQVYFIDGLGGTGISKRVTPIAGSQATYTQYHGALLVGADTGTINFQFIDINGKVVDTYTLNKNTTGTSTPTNTPTNTPIPTNTPPTTTSPTATPTTPPTNTPINIPTAPAVTNTPTPVAADMIFADDFESGTVSAWSATTNSASSKVAPAAALVGTQGWQVSITSNTATYLTDNSPNAEARYRVRFYFDPNTIVMADGNAHLIFAGYQGTTRVLRTEFRLSQGKYQVRAGTLDDGSTWKSSSWFTISDASHAIELDWQAATAAAANNGVLTLWIDGMLQTNVLSIDNDTRRIDAVRLGPSNGIDSGTRGTYYFDDFVSRRQSAIGLATVNAAAALDAEELEELQDAYVMIPNEYPALTAEVVPGEESVISGPIGDLTVQAVIPGRAVTAPVSVILHGLDDTALPDGYALLGNIFDMKVFDSAGVYLTQFAAPVRLTIAYGKAPSQVSPSTDPTLWRWNGSTGLWEALPATIDYTAQTITVELAQPATLGILQPEAAAPPQSQSIYLPLIENR